MRNLICLVLLLFSGNVFAATGSGNVSNVLTLGGVNSASGLNISESNSQGYFTLNTGSTAFTTAKAEPLWKNGVRYQVTAGKTFKASKVCLAAGTASAGIQMLYADAIFAYEDTLASLTNPVYQGGVSSAFAVLSPTTALSYNCFDITWDIPASKYAGITVSAATSYFVYVIGKEI